MNMLRSLILLAFLVSSAAAAAIAEPEPATRNEADTVCKDKEESCEGWKRDGFCETQRDLMSYYCAATCGVCQSVVEATEVFVEVVDTLVETTDSTGGDDDYWNSYYDNNDYDSDDTTSSGYDSNYDSSSYDTVSEDVPADTPTATASISNQCAGEVKNGMLKEMSPSNYGYVECNTGFTRNGPYYIYCNEQGILTGDLPTCERKCSEITVEGGSIEPPENEKQGWLYVSCNEGLTLEGNAWNWCDRGVVDYMPVCTGGSVTTDVTDTADTSTDTSTDTSVDTSVDTSADTSTTDDNTSVETDTATSSEETADTTTSNQYSGCPLETVLNGVWTDPYMTATYWILECNTGYVKVGGDDYTYCDEQKNVMGVSPTCGEDKCAATTVENGVVTTSGEGTWIWVQVDCVAGYTLIGNMGTYCNSQDGTLTGEIGTCSK